MQCIIFEPFWVGFVVCLLPCPLDKTHLVLISSTVYCHRNQNKSAVTKTFVLKLITWDLLHFCKSLK